MAIDPIENPVKQRTGPSRRTKLLSLVGTLGAFLAIPVAAVEISGYSLKDLVLGGPAPAASSSASPGTSVSPAPEPSTVPPPPSPTQVPQTPADQAPAPGNKPHTTPPKGPGTVSAVAARVVAPGDGFTTSSTKVNVTVRKPAAPAGRVWYIVVASSRHTVGYFFLRVQENGLPEAVVEVGIGPAGEPGVATYTVSIATLTEAGAAAVGDYGDSKPLPSGTTFAHSIKVLRTA